jgi:pimeloyl-ACP methyl ester carboxylesterase/DNA-binding CsgD family transcriptional regulator
MNTDKVNELISTAYALTLAPEKYDEFIKTFDDIIFPPTLSDTTKTDKLNPSTYELNQSVNPHYERAHNIVLQMGRTKEKKNSASEIVERAPSPAIVFDQSEHVLAMNSLAKKDSGTACTTLSEYCSNTESLESIRTFMTQGSKGGILVKPGSLCCSGKTSSCIIVRKISATPASPAGISTRTEPGPRKYFLCSIDLSFTPEKMEFFQQVYHLTNAEADVATRLAAGQQPQEISDERGASLNTVRSQIRIIKNKTQTRNIGEIIRLVCGLTTGLFVSTQVDGLGTAETKHPKNFKRRAFLTLSDSRSMSYLDQGDPSGAPVILIHNMLYGSELPDNTAHAAARQKIRIIAPDRPGYGRSDLAKNKFGAELLNTVAKDICELLDHLGIQKAIIMGQAIGSVYALRFAKLYPHRTASLFSVSHAPMWKDSWLNELPVRQRFIARLTKYVPKLLPLITRSGVALIDKGESKQFIEALHKDIPADAKVLRSPDLLQHISRGLEETVAQGSEAFCRDCPLALRDFTPEAQNLHIPFHIIHGDGDQVVKLSRIEAFQHDVPNTQVEIVKGAGQFLIYSHWEVVLNALKKNIRSTK